MIRILLILAMLLAPFTGAAAGLSVVASILHTGYVDGRPACMILAEVRNTGTEPVDIAMWSTTWWNAWITVPEDRFHVGGTGILYGHNFRIKRTFPAGGGYSFRFLLTAIDKTTMLEGQKIKVGFRPLRWIEEGSTIEELQSRQKQWAAEEPTPIWSTELTVPIIIDREFKSSSDTEGEIKELPTLEGGVRPERSGEHDQR